jgi:hypothetical protein
VGEGGKSDEGSEPNGLRFWQRLVLALVALVSAVLVAYLSNQHGKESAKRDFADKTSLVVRVFDSVTNTGVQQADLTIRLPNGESEAAKTDSTGQHTFSLTQELAGEVAQLRISKVPYSDKTFEVLLPKATSVKDYYLDPSPASSVKPVSPPIETPSDGRPAAPTGLTATVMEGSTPVEISAPPEEIQVVTTSGPKPSGSGDSFSPWYLLCSSPAPAGYKILPQSSNCLAIVAVAHGQNANKLAARM